MAKRVQRSRKRKEKKNVSYGVAHIYSTFNNTIVTLTDKQGNALSWASGGNVGFKGTRKSTPYAAQMSAAQEAKVAQDHGVVEIDVVVCHPFASGGGAAGKRNPRRNADPAQRMPSAQAAPRVVL